MNRLVLLAVLLSCFHNKHVYSANLPGPLVYVVTPSPRPPQVDTGRSAPFYYHKWMSRMDSPRNTTLITTTTARTKTPDLIFAEFESNNNNMKSIRKLLEKEKIQPKTTTTTTTTSSPIYVPDEETNESNYGLPVPNKAPSTENPVKTDMTDYFALYNNLYNSGPVYVPPVPTSSALPSPTTTTSTITTTSQAPMNNVENIWHIIDNEKQEQYSGTWEEEPVSSEQSTKDDQKKDSYLQSDDDQQNEGKTEDDMGIDDNFALPGFGTNPGNAGENESRAIRTEPNIRFPYVDLKPLQMKNFKKSPFNSLPNGKKGSSMFNLDNFTEMKNPVRGEVQDPPAPMQQPIDRYNPAQPYLPQPPTYGGKSKPSAPVAQRPSPPSPGPPPSPVNAIASLVPPPPPPAPKLTADDFPTPTTYESFPPYAPSAPAQRPVSSYQSLVDSGPDIPPSSSDDDGTPADTGYRYKPPSVPSPPSQPFVPTVSPPSKPFMGYSYNKPPMAQDDDSPPAMDMESNDFQGYQYNKPASPAPSPPVPPQNHVPSYGSHDGPSFSYQPESDYPELIFDKPHGNMGGIKGGDDMKGNDMGMVPPPPPPADMAPDANGAPMDDHGFPNDFPGDFKYHHDFDEHDHDHYHYHHTTTTTTTTEMPRVNRYSYYYLGKKLYYLPLYFSVYFIIYVGALIIKAVLRHKITYPNSWRPNTTTAGFFSKRSIESHLSNENLHEITGRVTKAIATAAEKYISEKSKEQ